MVVEVDPAAVDTPLGGEVLTTDSFAIDWFAYRYLLSCASLVMIYLHKEARGTHVSRLASRLASRLIVDPAPRVRVAEGRSSTGSKNTAIGVIG